MSDELAKANNLKGESAPLYQAAGHADGVYFGLPAKDYHDDPALGSSGVRDLMISPLRYWINSPYNPDRPKDEDTETAAKFLGSYLHDLLLEGGTAPYAVKPSGMSFATKDGKAWRDEQEEAGRVIVTQDQNRSQLVMFRALEQTGVLDRFDGGEPEVSVFWTEKGGQRCKIRIDYLKADEALDLKTYANSMDQETEVAVARTVAARRISVSAFWYDRGIGKMLEMLKADPFTLRTSQERTDLVTSLRARAGEAIPHWYVFCETGRYPNITARRFESHDNGELNAYWRWAKMGVEFATSRFATCMAKYGPDKPWLEDVFFKEFVDDDFASASWILAKD